VNPVLVLDASKPKALGEGDCADVANGDSFAGRIPKLVFDEAPNADVFAD
jgi:hypothetical protein